MRHASVRIRKLVKLGTTINARRIAFHFSRHLEDEEVRHREAEDEAQRRGDDRDLQRRLEHGEERRIERVAVVLQLVVSHVDRHARARRGVLDAERVPHDQQDRQDEEEEVPEDRGDGERERRCPQPPPPWRISPSSRASGDGRLPRRSRHVTLGSRGVVQHQAPAAALTLFMMSTKRSSAGVITWVRIVLTCSSLKKIMSPYVRSGLSSLSSWPMFFMPEL